MSSQASIVSGGFLRLEVVRSFSENPSLESAWNHLWIRANGHYHESYTVCRHAWEDLMKPGGSSLNCLLVWHQDRLLLAWPLVRYRKRFLNILKPLTPSGGEANSILLDADCEAQQLAQAWKAATSIPGCDLFHLPLLRTDSPLLSLIPPFEIEIGRDAAPCARLTLEGEWETYSSAIGVGAWQQVARKRKKIFQKGGSKVLCIDPAESPALAAEWIEWMLVEKKYWAERAQKHDTWVDSPRYRDFLVNSIADARETIKYRLYAILVYDKPIAVKLIAICPGHIEYVIGAYASNPEVAKLSPGLVLDGYWMKDAFDMNLDVDFGTGQEPYKLFWSRGNVQELRTYRFPLSLKGKIVLRSMRWIQ